MDEDALWNSYFYDGTDVLINNYNIRNYEQLKDLEASITFEKLFELNSHPLLEMNFDANHLKAIHKYLFGEIYPFAGSYRYVNMTKEVGSFLSIKNKDTIDDYLNDLFIETEEMLRKSHSKFEFAVTLGNLYTKLIYAHPFREGNGRTVREFVREYSIKKSEEIGLGKLELDFSLVNRNELNKHLAVAHMYPAYTGLLFNDALVPIEKEKNIK